MTLDSPLISEMQDRCRVRRIVATANIYLAEQGHRYSATAIINSDGEIVGCSKKMHIAYAPCFYEQDYFSPSDEGFQVYETDAGNLGVVICYDRHYPESIRSCALQGADIILIPTANTLVENLEMFEWEIRVAAFQSNVFIALCNRVGVEHEMTFAGESIIVDPNGLVMKKGNLAEQMIVAELDYQLIHQSRQERPYLALHHSRLSPPILDSTESSQSFSTRILL